MADNAWRNLRDLATANDWTEIVALIDQLEAGPAISVLTPDGTDAEPLVRWCATAAPAVTFARAREPSDERFLIPLPVPVDAAEAPRLFARIRRWCADRSPESYLVVLMPGPDADGDLTRVRRTLDRLLSPSAHVTRPADDDRLGEFLRAPEDPAVRQNRLYRLLGAIDRIPAPAPAQPTGHLETGLLLGIDRVEQRVRRDLDAGRLAPAAATRELTSRFRSWEQDARDRLREVSPATELPAITTRPPTTGRRSAPGIPSEIAAAAVGAAAGAAISRAARNGNGGLGAAIGAAAVLTWRAHQQNQAKRAAEVAEAKRLVEDTAAAARAGISRFVADLNTPGTADLDVLRAARERLLDDIDARKATHA